MIDELAKHPKLIFEVLAIYWGFSAVVSGMPQPPTGSFWYSWLYTSLHMFAGNISKFADAKLQSLETNTVTVTKKVETSPEPPKEA